MRESVITLFFLADDTQNRNFHRGEKVHLQHLLSFQHHPVHRQDLESQVVPEDQPNLLDQNPLGLPGKVTPVSHFQCVKQHMSEAHFHSLCLLPFVQEHHPCLVGHQILQGPEDQIGNIKTAVTQPHIWVISFENHN